MKQQGERRKRLGSAGRALVIGVRLVACGLSLLSPFSFALLPVQDVPHQTGTISLTEGVVLPAPLQLSIWNGLPTVYGMVGSTQERFVLDTGFDANALMPWARERYQLPPTDKQYRVSVLDVQRDAPQATLPALKLGAQLQMEKIPGVLLDVFGVLSPRPHPDAPLGWLGTPFLSAFQVTFDFPGRLVLLQTRDAPLPTVKDVKTVDLVLKEGRVWVTANVPGAKPFEALLSTGAPGTLLPTDVVQSLKLQPKSVVAVARGEQKAQAGLYVIPRLSLGSVEVKDLRAVALLPGAPSEFDPKLAVLGVDFLQRHKVTFSYAKQKVAFSPNDSPKPVQPPDNP